MTYWWRTMRAGEVLHFPARGIRVRIVCRDNRCGQPCGVRVMVDAPASETHKVLPWDRKVDTDAETEDSAVSTDGLLPPEYYI